MAAPLGDDLILIKVKGPTLFEREEMKTSGCAEFDVEKARPRRRESWSSVSGILGLRSALEAAAPEDEDELIAEEEEDDGFVEFVELSTIGEVNKRTT